MGRRQVGTSSGHTFSVCLACRRILPRCLEVIEGGWVVLAEVEVLGLARLQQLVVRIPAILKSRRVRTQVEL